MGSTSKTLHDTDFVEWSDRMAELLRARRFDELDIENLAEEVESLGIGQRRELRSRITNILEHLLRLELISGDLLEQNRRGWRSSISRQRTEIDVVLEDSPSLSRLVEGLILKCYRTAALRVEEDYGVTPPKICPFSAEKILGCGAAGN